MAIQRAPTQTAKLDKRSKENNVTKEVKSLGGEGSSSKSVHCTSSGTGSVVIEEHLPPLLLTFTILICSGALLVLGVRDFFATGRNISGKWDEAMLIFTKSTFWFDDSKGWKSTQGGFSAVQQVSTDQNNMGGFFVRKMAGAAAIAVHMQKLFPMLFHPDGAQWIKGHFHPLLITGLASDVALALFYAVYLEDLASAGVFEMPATIISVLAVESIVIAFYLLTTQVSRNSVSVAMKEGKTPDSVTSRIVTRTVMVVSGAMALIAGRDLFSPGFIFNFIPRDDIYLEWTNAFFHSPPEGTPEAFDQGLEAAFFVGDKFVSQLMAVHVLILCLYKFVTAFMIRYGNDGSGEIKCRMIWKVQAIGDAMILFLFRLFTPSAGSASLDLRWHLMLIAYETFILGLYGFF